MATWITSDLHLCHKHIVKLEQYNLESNGFTSEMTMDEYNNMIIQHINSVVKPDDTLYILGDVLFGGVGGLQSLIPQINGHKILIMGNHDRFQEGQALNSGFEKVYSHPIYLPDSYGKIILSHYPVKEAFNNPYVYNIHGHLHSSKLTLPNYLNVNIAMHHYYPIKLSDIIKGIICDRKNRREKWLDEWYAEYQQFVSPREDLVLKEHNILDVEATRKKQQKK